MKAKFLSTLILLFFLMFGAESYATNKLLFSIPIEELVPYKPMNESITGLLQLFCKKQIVLWDSPQMKRKISLEEICDSKTQLPYTTNQLSKVYVYVELIPGTNKKWSYLAYGISFVLKNKEISNGYFFDMYDINSKAIESIESKGLECNFKRKGLANIINAFEYNYDVVFFNKEEIKSIEKSEEIKKKYPRYTDNKKKIKEVVFSTKDMFEMAANPSANIDDSFNNMLNIPENAKVIYPIVYKPISTNVFYTNIYTQINYDSKNNIIDTQYVSFDVMLPDQRLSNRTNFKDVPIKNIDLIALIRKNKKGLKISQINNKIYPSKKPVPLLNGLDCNLTQR